MDYEFLNNKYKQWYFNIVKKALQQSRSKRDGIYYENHHIIPKSLGGTNNKDNLVLVTAREHFILHMLLIKMVDVKHKYKMVHAIIRFCAKINNSRQYENIRKIVSNNSKGIYNKSFGKIWAHNVTTKDIIYVDKILFENNINNDFDDFIKGLPCQRGGVTKNSTWINNGIDESFLQQEEPMPQGWRTGRIFSHDHEHMLFMASQRHTPEKDSAHAKKLKNRITLTDPLTKETIRVKPDDVDMFKTSGFIEGIHTTSLSKQCIVDGEIFCSINAAARAYGITPQTATYRFKSNLQRWANWAMV